MREKRTTTILKQARDLLSKRGKWLQGSLYDKSKGRYCAMGALEAVIVGEDKVGVHSPPRGSGYKSALALLDSVADGDVVEFNDAKGRRKKDVLAAFDKAIALSESKS